MLALALGAVAAMALVSCGGGGDADLLPGETASEINSNLDQVEQLVSEGDCVGAEDATAEVSAQVEALTGVDSRLKQALSEGAARLSEVVAGCEEVTSEETTEAIETAEEPETEKKNEKPEKSKPDKKAEEPVETENPSLPPQANGEGKGPEEGNSEGPPAETGPPSGGVGPSAPAGEE